MSSNRRHRRPPRLPPPSFLTRVNEFLTRKNKLPLWAMAGSLAVAALVFAWSFLNSYPEQRAHFDQASVRFHEALAAGDHALHVMDQLAAAFAAARAAAHNYQQTFGGKSVGDTLDRVALEQGANLSKTAQSRFGVAAAAVTSAQLPDAALNSATTAMRADLETQQKKMEHFSALYMVALGSDTPAISAAIKQVRADNDESDAVNEALVARLQHFFGEANRFHAQTGIEVKQATQEIQLFYLREASPASRSFI
jgi:hypothetical protein